MHPPPQPEYSEESDGEEDPEGDAVMDRRMVRDLRNGTRVLMLS